MMMMRLVADGMLNRVVSLGAPSVDEGRWMVPVRPGDTLRARYTVQEKRDLSSRPDVGLSKVLVELSNQKDETVANWVTITPDSKTIYVSNAGSRSVTAIDAAAMKVKAVIPVGEVPKRINTLVIRDGSNASSSSTGRRASLH